MKKEYICLSVILFIGFVLRIKGLIINLSLWTDESALAWNILNKGYFELFEKLRFLQIAPPLFLIFTKFLVCITDSVHHAYRCDFVLRIRPFICGNLSMIMFYFVAKKLFKSIWAINLGLFLIALNPVLINYSFEFKPYGADVLCSLIALYIFLNTDFKNDSLKHILIKGVILGILPWFSFASAFVIFSGFLFLSFKRDNPRMFSSMLMPVFVSAFVYLKSFIINTYSSNSAGMLAYWQNQFVQRDLSNLAQLNNENMHYFFANIPCFSEFIALLLVIAGFILFIKDRQFGYIFLSVLTFSSVISASIFKCYPYSQRMLLFLIPLVILYMAKIADIKKWFVGIIIFVFILIPHSIFMYKFIISKNINRADYSRQLMQTLASDIKTDETIVISEFSNTDFLYYNCFYNLKNKTEYLKPAYSKGETNKDLLNRLQKGSYWLFLSYDFNNKPRNDILEWINQNAVVTFKKQITQSILIRFTLN